MLQRSYLRPGGTPPTGVKILLLTFVVALVTFVFWGSRLYPDSLGLVANKAFNGIQLWRFVTGLLYFGTLQQVEIAPFLLGMTALWLFGSPLEGWLGRRRFLTLFFVCALGGHFGAALLGLAVAPGQAIGGASPGVWGMIVALGLIYWREQVYVIRPLPVSGKHLLIGLGVCFAIAVLYDLAKGFPMLPSAASALGGGIGALFVTRSWRPSELLKKKGRSRFVVLQGGRGGGGGRGGKKNGGAGGSHTPPKKLWN